MMAKCMQLVLLAAAVIMAAGHVEDSDLSSDMLTQVIDAAITRVDQNHWKRLKAEHDFTTAVEVQSCTPDVAKWAFPAQSEATGLFKRVLDTGKLKVAGVVWSSPTGTVANYNDDPPSGFWPEYLDAVLAEINTAYGTSIALERVYYPTSGEVVDAVDQGDVDCSEPYYYISGFLGTRPRIEAMAHSCVTAGTQGHFFTRADSGINSMSQLSAAIESGNNKIVGFIGQGNWDSNSKELPSSTQAITTLTNATEMEQQVQDGTILAGYVSEGSLSSPTLFNVFSNEIVSPRVFLFRKDVHSDIEVGSSDDGDDIPAEILATVVVLASAVFLVVVLLSVMVVKERKGSPLFTPLVE